MSILSVQQSVRTLAHDHPKSEEARRLAGTVPVDPRPAGGMPSHAHEAEPGGARLEAPRGEAALAVAVG